MRTHLGCILLVALITPAALARTWTDNTGKYRLDAEYAHADDTDVYLRTTDGKLKACRLDRLSRADAEHVRAKVAQDAKAPRPGTEAAAAALKAAESQSMTDVLNSPRGHFLLAAMQNELTAPSTEGFGSTIRLPASYDGRANFVYNGCRSYFQLLLTSTSVPMTPPGGVGIVNYWLGGTHWMAFLVQVSNTPDFYFYKPFLGDPNTKLWALSRHPWCGCYTVWRLRKSGGDFYLFDHACREKCK